MSTPHPIKTLFANDIERTIEEVIKVDQRDEQILVDELAEYVVTNSIRSRFTAILEAYQEAPNKPTDGVGVWVSGFYGSGKSSFAKNLGLAIQNRTLGDIPASRRLADRGVLAVTRDRTIDLGRAIVGPRYTGAKLIGLLALLAFAALAFVPIPGRVGADAEVKPELHRSISPPFSG